MSSTILMSWRWPSLLRLLITMCRYNIPPSPIDDHGKSCLLHISRLHLRSWNRMASPVTVYPNGVHNDICFSSSRHILIWLYPEKPSIKDILSKTHVLSIMMSVICNENSSLEHVALRSRKSVQTLIFLFFLRTCTMLATQFGCCPSRMKPHSMFGFIAAIMWVKIVIVVA